MVKSIKKTRRWTIALLLLSTLVLSLGCSSVRVRATQNPNADFSQYKTYAWDPPEIPETVALPANIKVRTKLRQAIDKQLAEKGYRLVELSRADLVLSPKGKAAERERRYAGDMAGRSTYRQGGGIGDPDYERPTAIAAHGAYRKATLGIELSDSKTKEVVWTAWVKGVVDDYASSDTNVSRFITPLMAELPAHE